MTPTASIERNAKLIAIQQPTFLPWLGWFDIADQVDLLIILDDVAFAKRSWQQRNRLRTPRELEFFTVPVLSSGRRGQSIIEVEIAEPSFADRLARTVSANYARAPYFRELFPGFCETLVALAATRRLCELNMGLIDWFFQVMGIRTTCIPSSALVTTGKRGDYLAALCEAVNADGYLSTIGSEAYLLEDRAAFDRRGIDICLHEYQHPVYQQVFSPFVPYACSLDLLFNEGPCALDIIRSGRRPSRPLGTSAANFVEDEHEPY